MDKPKNSNRMLRTIAAEIFAHVLAGAMSPRDFMIKTNRQFVVRSGGRRDNSKWSMDDLRAIRKRNGVGRPPHVIAARRGPSGL